MSPFGAPARSFSPFVFGLLLGFSSLHGQTLSLGEAATFGALGLNNGSLSINSATTIIGDIGYSNGISSTLNQLATDFTGGAYVHSGATFAYTAKNFSPSDGIVTGSTVDNRLNQANADITAASALLNSLTPSQNLGFLSDGPGVVINSLDSVNVIDVAGVTFNGINSITLNSRPGNTDTFIIRVNGDFSFSQSQILLNGLSAQNVLFYFPNASSILINKDSSEFRGTILAPTGSVEYHNPGLFDGAIIAENLTLHSGFNLTHEAFSSVEIPPSVMSGSPVPEPSASLLLACAFGAFLFGRRQREGPWAAKVNSR